MKTIHPVMQTSLDAGERTIKHKILEDRGEKHNPIKSVISPISCFSLLSILIIFSTIGSALPDVIKQSVPVGEAFTVKFSETGDDRLHEFELSDVKGNVIAKATEMMTDGKEKDFTFYGEVISKEGRHVYVLNDYVFNANGDRVFVDGTLITVFAYTGIKHTAQQIPFETQQWILSIVLIFIAVIIYFYERNK